MIYAYVLPRKRQSAILPPADTGFTSISAPFPPLYIQLTCRQLRYELMDSFYQIAVFQVGDVSAHHRERCSDPEYRNLVASPYFEQMRHIRVRISMDRMSMRTGEYNGIQFDELSPKRCVTDVSRRARMLVRALVEEGAENLRTVTVDWWDDFGEGDEVDRAKVFEQFARLEGVKFKVGKVQAFKKVKEKVKLEVEKGVRELNEGKVPISPKRQRPTPPYYKPSV
jgi:hypothetical protein